MNLGCWFSGFWQKNVANITKAAFYLSRLTFCQKNVLEKKNSTFAVFQGKILRISAGKCQEKISEGTNFAKEVIRIIYWPWRESSKLFPKSSQQSCQNGILRIRRMNSRKKNFGSIQFSDFLGHRAKLFGFYAKSLLQDYQLCMLLAQREFLGEISVWNLRSKFTHFKR